MDNVKFFRTAKEWEEYMKPDIVPFIPAIKDKMLDFQEFLRAEGKKEGTVKRYVSALRTKTQNRAYITAINKFNKFKEEYDERN